MPQHTAAVGALCALALVLALPAAAQVGPRPAPEVWMNHVRMEPLARPGARWDFVKRNLGALEFPINVVAFLMPAGDMKRLVAICRENGVRIAVECGYFDWSSATTDFSAPSPKGITDTVREDMAPGVGERTAAIEIGKLRNLARAGAAPDYLNLDGPIRRMLWPGSDVTRGDIKGLASVDDCVRELVAYMRAMRREFPRVRFLALTNFPNWGWRGEPSYWGGMFYGDYFDVLRRIIDGTRAAGIPIAGVTADDPYEHAAGLQPHKGWMQLPGEAKPTKPVPLDRIDWMRRLLDLERYVRGRGLRFNLIVNSQGGGGASDQAFARGTLDYLYAYRRAGGRADRYIVQSWYRYPETLEPEDDPTTMTGVTKTVIERLRAPAPPAPTEPPLAG
ncbi:MAG: hypothetical protein IT208_00925 [Chthonomonadales bacterium]|nr:hypothetical protein [Chthonomonadales bacterium]